MKSAASVLFVPVALLATSFAVNAQTTYQIDPAHSAAEFSVRHMTVSNVKGEFSKLTGTVVYDSQNLGASKVDASIDTSTLTTRDPDRDKHLRSPDFFDVTKYPEMAFHSTEFVKGGNGLQIKGNLTLHGVTKPVVLDVDGPTAETKDPWGHLRVGASASTTINRKDFGLVWNKALDGGGVLVGDDVKITLDIEGVKK